MGFTLLALDIGSLGLSLFPQSLLHLDFTLSAFGLCCSGVSSLALDIVEIEPPLFLKASMRVGPLTLVYGLSCCDSLMLTLDPAGFDLSLLSRSLS